MIQQYDRFLKDSLSKDTVVNHKNYRRSEKVQIDREWNNEENLIGRFGLSWSLKSRHYLDIEKRGHLRQEKATVRTLSRERTLLKEQEED